MYKSILYELLDALRHLEVELWETNIPEGITEKMVAERQNDISDVIGEIEDKYRTKADEVKTGRRLIDADKLFLHLNDWAYAESPNENDSGDIVQKAIYETILDCMDAVEEQPTVYDTVKRGGADETEND